MLAKPGHDCCCCWCCCSCLGDEVDDADTDLAGEASEASESESAAAAAASDAIPSANEIERPLSSESVRPPRSCVTGREEEEGEGEGGEALMRASPSMILAHDGRSSLSLSGASQGAPHPSSSLSSLMVRASVPALSPGMEIEHAKTALALLYSVCGKREKEKKRKKGGNFFPSISQFQYIKITSIGGASCVYLSHPSRVSAAS